MESEDGTGTVIWSMRARTRRVAVRFRASMRSVSWRESSDSIHEQPEEGEGKQGVT